MGNDSNTLPGEEAGGYANGADVPTDVPEPSLAAAASLFECSECSALALRIDEDAAPPSCHGRPMESIDPDEFDDPHGSDSPESVADPAMAVYVHRHVRETGMVSVAELADRLGCDRATVSEHLAKLVELGLFERHALSRSGGGTIDVYEPRTVEYVRFDGSE